MVGAATVGQVYRIMVYDGPGWPQDRLIDREVLLFSLLPSGLFLAASLIRWRSVAIQRMVAVAAALVGILCIGAIQVELSGPFYRGSTGPGTGTLAYLAWLVGLKVAVVVLLIAAATMLWEWFGRKRPLHGESLAGD